MTTLSKSKFNFDTKHLKSDLKAKAVRGSSVVVLSQSLSFIFRTISTIVLARLLTPSDFGLIAMVTSITSFASMFQDLGLSTATVQKPNITHFQISTLFWINVFFGVFIAFVVSALSPAIAWFYNDRRLIFITIALSSVFIIGGFSTQHKALIQRQMRFTFLGILQIISIALGIISALFFAALGAGYWALVLLPPISSLTTAIGVWGFSNWRPGLPRRNIGVKSMLTFGGDITLFNLINYFHRNLDNILIGKYFGAISLGLYNRAYNLMMLPIQQFRAPLNSIFVPVLSRLQSDPIKFKNYYNTLISILATVSMPLMSFLGIFSKEVIYLVLGNQWIGAATLFQIMCITAFIQPVFTTRGLVLISLGQSKRYLISGLIQSSVFVLAILCGLPWGAKGVATSYCISNYLLIVPMFLYCFKYAPVSIIDFFKSIWRAALTSFILAVSLFFVKYRYMLDDNYLNHLFIGICITIFLFVGLWSAIPGGFKLMMSYIAYLRFIFNFKKNIEE